MRIRAYSLFRSRHYIENWSQMCPTVNVVLLYMTSTAANEFTGRKSIKKYKESNRLQTDGLVAPSLVYLKQNVTFFFLLFLLFYFLCFLFCFVLFCFDAMVLVFFTWKGTLCQNYTSYCEICSRLGDHHYICLQYMLSEDYCV